MTKKRCGGLFVLSLAAFSVLSGVSVNAANILTNGDFTAAQAIVVAGGGSYDSTEAAANLGKWQSRSSTRWAIDQTNDWAEVIGTGTGGGNIAAMLQFVNDATTGGLTFSFKYKLSDAGGDSNPLTLTYDVFALDSTNWIGTIDSDGCCTAGSLSDSAAGRTLLASGSTTTAAGTFATVTPTIADGPVGTQMYAVRFAYWGFQSGDLIQVDDVNLTVVPEPASVTLLSALALGLVGFRRRRNR